MEERQRGLSGRCHGARVAGLQPCKQPPFGKPFKVGISPYCRPKQETYYTKQHGGLLTWYHPCSLFVWLWLVINGRKFSAGTIFFSHTNQPAVLLHKPATIRNSQPNRLTSSVHPHLIFFLTLKSSNSIKVLNLRLAEDGC